MSKKIEEWDITQALDTLIRAEEIKNNKILFPKVQKAFLKKLAAMKAAALELRVTKKLNTMHQAKGKD